MTKSRFFKIPGNFGQVSAYFGPLYPSKPKKNESKMARNYSKIVSFGQLRLSHLGCSGSDNRNWANFSLSKSFFILANLKLIKNGSKL